MKKVIKMTPKRVAFVQAAREILGESTNLVDRADIKTVELKSGLSYPQWLVKGDTLKKDRGLFHLPNDRGEIDEVMTVQNTSGPVPSEIRSAVSEAVVQMAPSAVGVMEEQDSYVPEKFEGYVAWGNFNILKEVLKSRIFYPMFITGLSGNGKTLMVKEICARLKREYVRANITVETDEDDLIGGFRLLNGETVWHDGPVVTAMKRGALLLLDEIDLASNKIMCLQPVLEGSSIYLKKIGKWVHPVEGFNVLATANTKGQGSEDGRFIGTNVMNESFLERFPATIEQTYPTNKIEEKILVNELAKHDKVENDFVSNLVKWADVIRKTFYEGGVDEIISTRRLVHIVNAFSIFDDKVKAISMCISRFDTETKESFLDLYSKVDAGVSVEDIMSGSTIDDPDEDDEEEEINF
jgi:MoxR-like ATPase